jgi:hypothetical protein
MEVRSKGGTLVEDQNAPQPAVGIAGSTGIRLPQSSRGDTKEETDAYYRQLLRCQDSVGKRKTDLAESVARLTKTLLISGGISLVIIIVFVALSATEAGSEFLIRIVGVLGGLAILGIGIGLVGLAAIVAPFWFAIGAAMRLARRLPRFRRPTTEVQCPTCDTRHALFNDVDLYVCPECSTILVQRVERPSTELLLGHCPYCARKIASGRDYGDMTCGNCKAALSVRGVAMVPLWEPSTCTICHATIPSSAVFCLSCHSPVEKVGGCVKVTSALYEMLWAGTRKPIVGSLDRGTRNALDALLWHDLHGRLADSKARIASIQDFDATQWESLEQYFVRAQTPEVKLFFDLLLGCAGDERFPAHLHAIVRAADERHAVALQGVVGQLMRDNTLEIARLRNIENAYLSFREGFLSKLGHVRPGLANRFDAARFTFGKYPKEAKLGRVASTAFLDNVISRLRTGREA